MRRTILMMSDLQSGAEEMEIVDAASFDRQRDALLAIEAALTQRMFSRAAVLALARTGLAASGGTEHGD